MLLEENQACGPNPLVMMLQGKDGMGNGMWKEPKTFSERSLGVLPSHFTFFSFSPLEQECPNRYVWNHWNVFFQGN